MYRKNASDVLRSCCTGASSSISCHVTQASRESNLGDDSIGSLLGELMGLALVAQPADVDNEKRVPLLVLPLPSYLQRRGSGQFSGRCCILSGI